MRLFFATQNPGKVRELAALCVGLPIAVTSFADVPGSQAEETGKTFAENAVLKARAAAIVVHGWALADDSGLCVDALDGAPGLFSARWSGGGDEANNALLLRKLEGVSAERRGARYRCALALCEEGGQAFVVEDEVEGRIALAPRGEGGFGYDPLFELPGLGKTFAQIPPEFKDALSHRGKAFRRLVPILRRLCGISDPAGPPT
jgi:XTP/dITP diphosphohydrolase